MNANIVLKSLKKEFGVGSLKYNEDRKPYLGISFPNLKLKADEISKANPIEFLDSNDLSVYELEILQAMVIGKLKDFALAKKYFLKLAPKAKSWSVVDALCQKFILTKKHREEMFEVVLKFANKNSEFEQRIASVLLLSHFIEEEYLERSFKVFNILNHDGYFAKMGKAWAITTFYTKFPKETLTYMKNNKLDRWTLNKAIQKIDESFRIRDQDKAKAKELRK